MASMWEVHHFSEFLCVIQAKRFEDLFGLFGIVEVVKGRTGREPAAAQMLRTGKVAASDFHSYLFLTACN